MNYWAPVFAVCLLTAPLAAHAQSASVFVSVSAGVNVIFYSLPGCEGSNLKQVNGLKADVGQWQLVFAEESSTFETRSIAVRLVVVKPFDAARFQARIDNVLVTHG